jgi:methionyl-tRNA formyltransferase
MTVEKHMRIVFMGTPAFSVPTLDALVARGHDVIAVYSQPPRRAGRGKAMTPSPVHLRAEALGIAVHHPERLRDPAVQAEFAALEADVAVVAAYGLILPRAVLEAPRLGCINVHASLLPRWRGAAPVQRAILAGDELTGVTIMQMGTGLDTGPMLARVTTAIDGKTAGELTDELARVGADLLVATLGAMPPAIEQPEAGVTYADKIDKAEARLDFARPAVDVERQVRAFAPTPGAWFEHAGERVRVMAAEVGVGSAGGIGNAGIVVESGKTLVVGCDPGVLRITRVQRAGRGVMTTGELLRGFPVPTGTQL